MATLEKGNNTASRGLPPWLIGILPLVALGLMLSIFVRQTAWQRYAAWLHRQRITSPGEQKLITRLIHDSAIN